MYGICGRPNGRSLVLAVLGVAALAGCAHHRREKASAVEAAPPPPPIKAPEATTPQPSAPPAVAAVPGRSPPQRYQAALQALQEGRTPVARVELVALLQEQPSDRRARSLLTEIDVDPRQLYGSDSFSYTIQSGDTLFSLSKRFLKNPLNFYGLARFNNLTLPVELQPGQQILIPGHYRAPERAVTPRRTASSQSTAPTESSAARAEITPAARQQAHMLRRQGLEQMSAGAIDRAVTLLSQANSFDPEDGAIAGDLARARRIQATVHSK